MNLPGGSELFVCFVLALIILGPKRLPEVARQAGVMLRKFRDATAGLQEELRGAVEPITAVQREIRSTIMGSAATAAASTATGDPTPTLPPKPGAAPMADLTDPNRQVAPPTLIDEAVVLQQKNQSVAMPDVVPPTQNPATE